MHSQIPSFFQFLKLSFYKYCIVHGGTLVESLLNPTIQRSILSTRPAASFILIPAPSSFKRTRHGATISCQAVCRRSPHSCFSHPETGDAGEEHAQVSCSPTEARREKTTAGLDTD